MAHDDEPPPTTEPQVTYHSGADTTKAPDVRILHYNDVYHLDAFSAEPVGGFPRFMTVCKEYRDGEEYRDQPKLVTLFSGDAFNPSLESSITKGVCLRSGKLPEPHHLTSPHSR